MWDRAASTDVGTVGSGTFCRTMSDARTLEATRRRPHADAPSLPRSEVGVLIISISTKTIVDRLLFFRNKNLPPPINIFDCHEFGQDHDIKQKILLVFSYGSLLFQETAVYSGSRSESSAHLYGKLKVAEMDFSRQRKALRYSERHATQLIVESEMMSFAVTKDSCSD